MRSGRTLLAAAVVVALAQGGFIASVIYGRAALLRTGKEIVLKTEPVDPRDLLRGDYVSLNYNISRISVGDIRSERAFDGDTVGAVYVRVRQESGNRPAKILAASLDAPLPDAPANGEVDIKGKSFNRWMEGAATIRVEYGLERFYVPEGEGREIERGLGVRPFTMRVAVGENGDAQIKALYDGPTALYREPFY